MKVKRYYKTPIHSISESINNNQFYIKREDLLPFSFGGNKARKAILFFEDFYKNKANTIVTYGSSSSNHCRIIANIAASKNIPCFIITPTESNNLTYNNQMIKLFGAQIIKTSLTNVSSTINEQLNILKSRGYIPYFIPGGGHGNLGTQAYVNVYNEIVEFEKENKIFFDYIFHTTGTGTTQAGLICGKHINNDNRVIVGISIARKKPYGSNVIKNSINEYVLEHKLQPINEKEIVFIDDYVLDGYGTYNQNILQLIKSVLLNDGIPLDPTYTGKAYWGMLEFIKKNNIKNKTILFIHTGGTPLFFDKLEEL